VNSKLKPHEKISTIIITREVWSLENGLLTPTLKVKRNKMNDRYRNRILEWHEDQDVIIFE